MSPGLRINNCDTVRCEPGWQWDTPANHFSDVDLWYVYAGVGTIRLNDATYPVHRGRLLLIPPAAEVHARHDPQRRLGVCYIHFDPPGDCADILQSVVNDMHDADLYERLLRRTIDLQQRHHTEAAAHLLQSVLISIPHDRIADPDDADPEARHREARIADTMRYIRENPGQMPTVEELADRVSYAVDHFTRLFTRAAGVGPKEFCVRVRIERAQQLLRNSDMSMKQIAMALGYGDVFFFSRQFKARTGLSPTRYRAFGH